MTVQEDEDFSLRLFRPFDPRPNKSLPLVISQNLRSKELNLNFFFIFRESTTRAHVRTYLDFLYDFELLANAGVVVVVVHQDDLTDQICRTPLKH